MAQIAGLVASNQSLRRLSQEDLDVQTAAPVVTSRGRSLGAEDPGAADLRKALRGARSERASLFSGSPFWLGTEVHNPVPKLGIGDKARKCLILFGLRLASGGDC